ncbi:DUF3072 domain-containing protein [Thetidibacter halocola]|uniref:DUF3072 domain-containing protein n=1 Tax=Thetidibacter halocola TaxID=2827239 RepID=A0A8J7WHF2_9RHOB|nr:DUF3072 domain-containing protein [Thetidibacter halocola]MBS0125094.1 DUF3072 domain-containing protein [Thetidibacter halocola]
MKTAYDINGPARGRTFDPQARMTEAQAEHLRALSERLGEPFDGSLSERQAARRIAALEEIAD